MPIPDISKEKPHHAVTQGNGGPQSRYANVTKETRLTRSTRFSPSSHCTYCLLISPTALFLVLHQALHHVLSSNLLPTSRPPSGAPLYLVNCVSCPRTPLITQLRHLSPPFSPSPTSSSAASGSPDTPHLPLNFGAEFELIIRPKDIASLSPTLRLPDFDASHRQRRDFNRDLLHVVSKLLSHSGLACQVFTPDEDDESKPDYSQWHITMDASLSKKHIADGFCE